MKAIFYIGGQEFMRSLSWLFACAMLGVSGCAEHNFEAGPGVAPAVYTAQSALCHDYARSKRTGVVAIGGPLFILGAVVANEVGQNFAMNRRYNQCMTGTGWVVADGAPGAPQPEPAMYLADTPQTVAEPVRAQSPSLSASAKLEQCKGALPYVRAGTETSFMDLCMK